MDVTIEKIIGPVKELNELTLKSIEKISAMQVKLVQENAQASMEALKASTAITDLDSLNQFMNAQMSAAQAMYSKSIKDAEKITKMAESYANEVKAIVDKTMAG